MGFAVRSRGPARAGSDGIRNNLGRLADYNACTAADWACWAAASSADIGPHNDFATLVIASAVFASEV